MTDTATERKGLRELTRRDLVAGLRRVRYAETALQTAKNNLLTTARKAWTEDGATLAQIGEVLGVSRQRVHQMLQGEIHFS